MTIRNPKDFWAGLMFITFGLAFVLIAAGTPAFLDQVLGELRVPGYQMGSAVRMGPAYFPVMLGGLLATLGAVILARSFVSGRSGEEVRIKLPFDIFDLAIGLGTFALLVAYGDRIGLSLDASLLAAALVVSLLAMRWRPNAKPLVLILAACIAFGYTLKPLGLGGAALLLIFVSALGGHEFKWREVAILFVVLLVFSVLVFVKGLTLPFPVCPGFIDNCPIR
jgi:putative tricarboxylic transport membrane protein